MEFLIFAPFGLILWAFAFRILKHGERRARKLAELLLVVAGAPGRHP